MAESVVAPSASPLRYDPSVEHPKKDEAETEAALTETMLSISKTTFKDGGHGLRSVHAKSHGLLRGELHVLGSLPSVLAQGLAAKPGTYPVVIRLSTTPGDILDDSVSAPRGMALKVVGVEGERLQGSEGDATQDFVMANAPAFGAPNGKKFLGSLKLLAATTDKAEGAKKVLSAALRGAEAVVEAFGGKSATLVTLGGQPETHILGGRLGRLARGPKPLRRGRPHQRAAPGCLERSPVGDCGQRPRFQRVARPGGASSDRVHPARAQDGVSAVRAVPERAQRLPDGGAAPAG